MINVDKHMYEISCHEIQDCVFRREQTSDSKNCAQSKSHVGPMFDTCISSNSSNDQMSKMCYLYLNREWSRPTTTAA